MEKQVIVIQGIPHTIFSNRDFLDLVDKFMGYDAMTALREYFESIDTQIEDAENSLKSQRHEIETYVLTRLLPSIKAKEFDPDDDIEEWANDFKAVMEDMYGIDE